MVMQYVKQLVRQAAATGSTTLYTTPVGKTAVATSIQVVNAGASTSTYTLLVGGVEIAKDVQLAGGQNHIYDVRVVLTAGQTIAGLASAGTNVKWHIAGVEA